MRERGVVEGEGRDGVWFLDGDEEGSLKDKIG